MPKVSDRVKTLTDSVIRRMTRISDEYGAINLSQGFPDFDPPKAILDRLAEVAYEGPHQYSITFGAENFREALAKKQGKAIGREINPETEIVVTCGGTEAMMSAMMTDHGSTLQDRLLSSRSASCPDFLWYRHPHLLLFQPFAFPL